MISEATFSFASAPRKQVAWPTKHQHVFLVSRGITQKSSLTTISRENLHSRIKYSFSLQASWRSWWIPVHGENPPEAKFISTDGSRECRQGIYSTSLTMRENVEFTHTIHHIETLGIVSHQQSLRTLMMLSAVAFIRQFSCPRPPQVFSPSLLQKYPEED